ncbi:MAG: response regulator transcription factor [Lachnospiraceae bacterium]|nr:response regulator transcription factor [Lachnospiraceae bacterium]
MKLRILVIEDDLSLGHFMQTVLEANGYQVITAQNGKLGYALITSYCPDAVILDLGLPDMDGMQLISQLREWSEIPVIVVSGRTRERDKVEALDAGADDYITKPFGTAELMARLRTALRHTGRGGSAKTSSTGGLLRVGGLTVDQERHIVAVDGEEVHLTQNEYKIVLLLARYAGRVLTYDFMKRELWGPMATDGNQILRVHMANIRRKIEKNPAEPQYIFTEIGVGYRMAETD